MTEPHDPAPEHGHETSGWISPPSLDDHVDELDGAVADLRANLDAEVHTLQARAATLMRAAAADARRIDLLRNAVAWLFLVVAATAGLAVLALWTAAT